MLKFSKPILILVLLLALASPVLAEEIDYQGLPKGKGRDTVLENCTACHTASIILQNHMTRKKWNETITWMQEKQGLWPLDPPDRNTILDYLAKFQGEAVSKPTDPQHPHNSMYQFDYPANPL